MKDVTTHGIHKFYIIMKLIRLILFLTLLLSVKFSASAQVTIGTTESPESGAILQLKNLPKEQQSGLQNANRGLGMPRVYLSDKNELYPMFLSDPEDPLSAPSTEYTTNKDLLDKKHTGLIVYNINEDLEKELCLGLNVWDGETWRCLNPKEKAKMSIVCSDIVVEGKYKKGEALTTSHQIKVKVNVEAAGVYRIYTPVTHGISFKAVGEFDDTQLGEQWVTLKGEGTPSYVIAFPISVIMETQQGNVQCETTIPMTLPAMTYAIIGSGGYSWVSSERQAALNPANPSFSSLGTFRIESFTEAWSASNASAAVTELQKTTKPDIILYFAYQAKPSVDLSAALAEYINAGGCVIYGSADNTEDSVNDMLEGVFGSRFAEGQVSGTGGLSDGWANADSYLINDLPDNPIVNGPFGNVAGKRWCEDSWSTGSVIMTSLPSGSVQICSASNDKSKAAVPAEYSIVWMNDAYNFVYFGDCVATSTSTSGNWWPSRYTSNGVPFIISQSYGGGKAEMANSILELNAVAWLINKAAVSGINEY